MSRFASRYVFSALMNLLLNKKIALLSIAASLFASGSVLAQSQDYPSGGGSTAGTAIGGVIDLAVAILVIAGMWKVFVKAGQPGWASIIPIYNAYILCKIAGKPGWWVVLMLIPLVNIIVGILVVVALAKSFGKGVGFVIGLILLPFVFWPMLGFGDATYQGAPA